MRLRVFRQTAFVDDPSFKRRMRIYFNEKILSWINFKESLAFELAFGIDSIKNQIGDR